MSIREYRELEAGERYPTSKTWDRICKPYLPLSELSLASVEPLVRRNSAVNAAESPTGPFP